MPKATSKGTAAIQRLLDERRQFEAWIARLDAAGDATPAAVRGRVRADYEARLRTVTEELGTHMDAVRQVVAQRRAVLGEQQEKEARAAERLAEAELRHAVGEYDEGQWTQVHKDALSELVSIREELQAITTEVERLEELESMVSESAAPPPSPPPPPPVMAEEPALTVVSDRTAGRGPGPAAPRSAPPPPPPPPPSRPVEERKLEKKHQPVDELAFLKSVTEDARGGASAAPPAPPPRRSGAQHQPVEPPPPPPPPVQNAPPGMSVRSPRVTPQEVDPVIVEEGEEPVKTLRCKDCGTMNLPTEWYCENCGAELAAL